MKFVWQEETYCLDEGYSVNPWIVQMPDGRTLEVDYSHEDDDGIVGVVVAQAQLNAFRYSPLTIYQARKKEKFPMMKKTMIVIDAAEARDALVKHYTDFLVSNPNHLAALLREGRLSAEIPNVGSLKDAALASMLRDNGIGAIIASNEGVDVVALHVSSFDLQIVYAAK